MTSETAYKRALQRVGACLSEAKQADTADAEQAWLYAASTAADIACKLNTLRGSDRDA